MSLNGKKSGSPDNDYARTIRELHEENAVLQTRLTLAQAFVGLLHRAYDALLAYGLNYRDLPEYKDDRALTRAEKVGVQHGQSLMIDWMGRVESALAAAIRRKMFKAIDGGNRSDGDDKKE